MIHRLSLAVVKRRLRSISTGIEVLSTYYKNNNTPMSLRCQKCGRRWKATAHNILKSNPTGCPQCGKVKFAKSKSLSFAEVEAKIRADRIKVALLKIVTGNVKEKRLLTCKVRCKVCDHTWDVTLCNLIHNKRHSSHGYHGCPQCRIQRAKTATFITRLTTREVKEAFAKHQKGLRFLGPYTRYNTSFKVQCKKCRHTWGTTMTLALHPQGNRPKQACPKCFPQYGASEERARAIIEKVTRGKFPKTAPSKLPWLHGLHLDGYNARLKVAFEYQGYQHYTWNTHYLKGSETEKKEAFSNGKKRDMRKRFQCTYHGVLLICIPYWKTEEEIEELVRKKLAHREVKE